MRIKVEHRLEACGTDAAEIGEIVRSLKDGDPETSSG